MDFSLSEEHKLIQKAARDFAQKAKEGVIERDTKMEYPTKTVAEMGELGFMGIMASPDYGGSGLDTLSYVLVMEELSKVDASAAVIMSAHNSLVVSGIEKHGSDEVKSTYLRPLVDGTSIGCFCLSEPEAGSDATSQQTTAIDKGDHYILNGVKNWITNGEKQIIIWLLLKPIAKKDTEESMPLWLKNLGKEFKLGRKRISWVFALRIHILLSIQM